MSTDNTPKPPKKESKGFEKIFESILWNSRFCVLLAVIFGLISAVVLFVAGSIDIVEGIRTDFVGEHLSSGSAEYEHADKEHSKSKKSSGHAHLVGVIIGSIDLYLIGVVLLIFSFGIYELFISHIDVGRDNAEVKILEITSLDDLKNRIIKVVIMVLVVSFFKRVLGMEFNTPMEMMYFAISIFAISFGVYFMHKAH